MEQLEEVVRRAQSGDLDAFGHLVSATQTMAYAAAMGVLRDGAAADDATQEAYLRAFKRLGLAMLRYGIDDVRKVEASRVT